MRKVFLIASCFLFILGWYSSCQARQIKESTDNVLSLEEHFADLCGKNSSFWKNFSNFSKEDIEDFEFYQKLYVKNIFFLFENYSGKRPRIPNTLHYIWLGPNPFPESSIAYVNSWVSKHVGWKVKFWTDDPSRPCPVDGMEKCVISEDLLGDLRDFFDETTNFGEKSDLLRYMIMYKEGGIYVDHDMECFYSFDDLAQAFDFFACLEAPHRNSSIPGRVFPNNGLFGAKPSHPILKETIERVQRRWVKGEKLFPFDDQKSTFSRVLYRTFQSFSLGVKAQGGQYSNRDIVFPAAFFFADRIFPLEKFLLLKEKRIVRASHKFASAWWNSLPADPAISLQKRMKKSLFAAAQKIKKLKTLNYINLAFSLILLVCFYLFRRKNGPCSHDIKKDV